MPTSAVFQLYRGMNKFYKLISLVYTRLCSIKGLVYTDFTVLTKYFFWWLL